MVPHIELQECIRCCRIYGSTMEPYSIWKNRAEGRIKIIKDKAKSIRIRRRVPKRIWDFVLVWEAEIYSHTAGKDVKTLMERLTGDIIDISELTEFEFYCLR